MGKSSNPETAACQAATAFSRHQTVAGFSRRNTHGGPGMSMPVMRALPRVCWRVQSSDCFPEHRLTRLTVNLQRPVPFDGFSVLASVVRQGRTVCLSEASLVDRGGKTVITAAGMHLLPAEPIDMPSYQQRHGNAGAGPTGTIPD